MKSLKLILLIVFVVGIANGQGDTRLNLDQLKNLEAKAKDVVEVNIDGKLLDLARRVMLKVNDKDAKMVGEAIKGLKGIYVRVYNFETENGYNAADIDDIRAQIKTPDWEKIANVRSKKNSQKIDVFTRFNGDAMSGMAVVMSEAKSVVIVNVVGPIDIDMLVELSGRMNIPKIDIVKESAKKPDEKEELKP